MQSGVEKQDGFNEISKATQSKKYWQHLNKYQAQ